MTADLTEAGVLGCMLVAAPASRLGARAFTAAENDDAPPAFTELLARLLPLVEQPATAHTRIIGFSPQAAAAWLAFAAETESAMASGQGGDGALASIRDFAAHLPEHAARLAAVIALIHEPNLEELSAAHLSAGLALARFYTEERLRFSGAVAHALSVSEKENLLRDWLRRNYADKVITLRDLCRTGPHELREVDTLYKLMRRMELAGVVLPSREASQSALSTRRAGARYAWRIEDESGGAKG